MENLSGAELILERYKKPLNQSELLLSQKKKLRQGVHSEPISSLEELTPGHRAIFEWIKDRVLDNEDSFKSLSGIMIPPFPTNELNQSVYSDCSRIFNAEDFFQKITWKTKNKDQEANHFLREINESEFWETQAIDIYRTDPDCYFVVDKPKAGSADMNPYFYTISTDSIFSIKLKSHKGIITVEYVIFKEDDKYIYFDDTSVAIIKDDYIQEIIPHGIGYTPVHPFWQSTLNTKTLIRKKNRDTASLAKYDWLFFYEYAKQWQDLNNPFPIWAMYDFKCTYVDKELNESCDKGYINYIYNGQPAQKRCPSCANKFRRGPDRIVRVPAPQSNEDPDLMSHAPVTTIAPQVDSMQFVTDEVERIRAAIYKNSAGVDLEGIKKQAVNKDQVASYFEGKRSILKWEKRNFDIARNWLVKTLLRYKFKDEVHDVHTDHGEEWYLESELDKVTEYKTAKDSGLPIYDLKSRREALIHSRFRNNPEKVDRAEIMAVLEPSPDSSLSELIEIKKAFPELITDEELILKKDFSNFIDRFERENGPLQNFGIDLTKDKVTDSGIATEKIRIDSIKKTLYAYITEYRGRERDDSGESGDEEEGAET